LDYALERGCLNSHLFAGVLECWSSGILKKMNKNSECLVLVEGTAFLLISGNAILRAFSSNTPALHHSNTPYEEHVTTEPLVSDLP
jgi:hypothetical protein